MRKPADAIWTTDNTKPGDSNWVGTGSDPSALLSTMLGTYSCVIVWPAMQQGLGLCPKALTSLLGTVLGMKAWTVIWLGVAVGLKALPVLKMGSWPCTDSCTKKRVGTQLDIANSI